MDGITQENAIHVLSLSFTNISSNAGSAYYCQLLKLHNVVFQFCNQPSTMSVAEAMAYSEQPAMKCVGITIETHPNFVSNHICKKYYPMIVCKSDWHAKYL